MANKLIYEDLAVNARENAYCMGIGGAATKQLMYTENGVSVDKYNADAIFSNTTPYNCVSFDNGGIELSQPAHIMGDGEDVGFVSALVSGADCTFSAPQRITIAFSDGSHSGNGIALYFNTHFCTKVKVAYYVTGSLVATEFVYDDLDSLYVYLPATVEVYDTIIITFLETQHPYQRAMVSMIEFGRVHELTDFHSLEYHKLLYLDCSDIAIGTLNATFQSKEELNFFNNQRILAYHSNDDENFTLIGTYWVTDASRETEVLYSVECEDVMSRLENTTRDQLFLRSLSSTGASKASTPINLLTDATGVPVISNIGSSKVYGWFPGGTFRRLFAHVLFAVQCFIKATASGSISIFPIPSTDTVVKHIQPSEILGDAIFEKRDKVTRVDVTFENYNTGQTGERVTVYRGYISTTGIELPVDYPIWGFPGYKDENGNIINGHYDSSTLNQEEISNVRICPNGHKVWALSSSYENDEVIVTYERRPKEEDKRTVERQTAIGEVRTIQNYGNRNFFPQDKQSMMDSLSQMLFSVKGVVRASYIGGDLDVGDYVSIETKHSGTMRGTVTEISGDVGHRNTIQDLVITVWE